MQDFKNNSFQKDKLERNEKGGFKIGTIYKTTELNPAIENLINKYKEQEKMIELMAKAFKQDDIRNEDEIIEYFRKKAKGE